MRDALAPSRAVRWCFRGPIARRRPHRPTAVTAAAALLPPATLGSMQLLYAVAGAPGHGYPGHPECPERVAAILDALAKASLTAAARPGQARWVLGNARLLCPTAVARGCRLRQPMLFPTTCLPRRLQRWQTSPQHPWKTPQLYTLSDTSSGCRQAARVASCCRECPCGWAAKQAASPHVPSC